MADCWDRDHASYFIVCFSKDCVDYVYHLCCNPPFGESLLSSPSDTLKSFLQTIHDKVWLVPWKITISSTHACMSQLCTDHGFLKKLLRNKLRVRVNGGVLDQGAVNQAWKNRILGWNPDKSRKNFPPCNTQSPLQLCLRFLFLQTHATSYSFCKGERRKNW